MYMRFLALVFLFLLSFSCENAEIPVCYYTKELEVYDHTWVQRITGDPDTKHNEIRLYLWYSDPGCGSGTRFIKTIKDFDELDNYAEERKLPICNRKD